MPNQLTKSAMASKHFIAFAIVAVILLPTVALATEYIVGDDKGWDVNVNYTAWAGGKVFHVGDKLVFLYKPPHNVHSVDAEGFKNCAPSEEGWTSGNDTITLGSPGKKWYICSYGKHCAELGQKLVVTVADSGPTSAPPPSNTAYGLALHQIFVVTMVVAATILV